MSHELYKFVRDNPDFLNRLESALSKTRGRYRKKGDKEFKEILNEGFLCAADIIYASVDSYQSQIPRRTLAKLKEFSSRWQKLRGEYSPPKKEVKQADKWLSQCQVTASMLLQLSGVPTEIAQRVTVERFCRRHSCPFIQDSRLRAIKSKVFAMISAEMLALPERMAPVLVDAVLGLDGGLLAPTSAKEAVIASELARGVRLMLESLCDRLRRGVPGYGDWGRIIGRAYAAGLSGQSPRRHRTPSKS